MKHLLNLVVNYTDYEVVFSKQVVVLSQPNFRPPITSSAYTFNRYIHGVTFINVTPCVLLMSNPDINEHQ